MSSAIYRLQYVSQIIFIWIVNIESPYLFILCAEILGILIRNNKDIKGINIDGEEYKISQYADDTSLITDGSPKSLDGILQILDLYANVSGLKINFSKTKIIWIGCKKFSKEVYHHSRWKFTEFHTRFNLLGISFSVNMEEMIDINYIPVMENIDKLLSRWNSRNLTPIGKITVIKTLIVPKINHLILTLPNPTLKFIRSFERKLFKFIWNEKPDKIKRSTLIQGYENAGLKMIDFENFMIALKSSWIRRLIFSNSKWTNLFKANFGYNMQTLMKFGIDFTSMIKKNSNNKFWKDVLQCWRTIIDVQKGNCDRMFNEHMV